MTAANSDYADAFAGLGLVREKQGQKDAAGKAYMRALQIQPDNFTARTGAARMGLIQPSAQDISHGMSQQTAPEGVSQEGGQ